MSESLSAVVVAAGRSQRMGFDKMLAPLCGRPLLVHTLERLFQTQAPAEIVLVIRPGSEAEMEPLIAPLREKGAIRLVPGGAQRQDSVQAGLEAVADSSDYVLVHDAARPFITKELVDTILAAAKLLRNSSEIDRKPPHAGAWRLRMNGHSGRGESRASR